MEKENRHIAFLRGADVNASYKAGQLKKYKDNPLIEALQPIISSEKVVRRLTKEIPFREKDRLKSDVLRSHCIFGLTHFIEPSNNHFRLEQALSILIRDSYVDRNPLTVNGVRILREGSTQLMKSLNSQTVKLPDTYKTSGGGVSMIGVSGMGKTTAINNVLLSMYPAQIIRHGQYKGKNLNFTQIVWLKLECPPNGSLKGLCLNFFQQLDALLGNTNYYENFKKTRATAVELIPEMAQLAATFRIGVIVIDEIQHLCEANVGGQSEMLNYFVTLKNSIGIAIVLIGTWKAWGLLNKEFRQTRRTIEHFGLIQWDRMKYEYEDGEWSVFINGIWMYQWTKNFVELNANLCETMYHFSQGITDVAIKLFMIAQLRAILDGAELISEELLKSVADNELRAFMPVIQAVRLNDLDKLESTMDLFITEMNMEQLFENVVLEMAKKRKTKKKEKSNDIDPKELEWETIQWLKDGGVPAQEAETIVRSLMEKQKDWSLPELKSEAFQKYQLIKKKIEKKMHSKSRTQSVKGVAKGDSINLTTDIILSGNL